MSLQNENVTLTLNQLNALLSGVIVAQKRGIYSFEESGALAEPVKIVSQFLKIYSDNEEKKKIQQQETNGQIPSTIQEDDLTLKNLI